MQRILAEQSRRNHQSRQGWDLYRHHRERVTQLLTGSVPSAGARLCILGAGNCNDLDLQVLRQRFSEIHLIDLDADALEAGCLAQGVAADPAIIRRGNIDLTGLGHWLGTWRPEQPPSAAELTDALHAARNVTVSDILPEPIDSKPIDREPFDVVASVGLLTQLIEVIDQALGTAHPQFLPLMSAVRLRHLQLLLQLTSPGGLAWLFTEVVSSVTCPELLHAPEPLLMAILQRAVAQQNFFTGVNPAILQQLFRSEPTLAGEIERLQTPLPWRWTFFTRTYAVCAIGATRKSQSVPS